MKNFRKQIQLKFDEMSQRGKLFRVALTGHEIWDIYLASFAKEDDPVFRDPSSSVHNCNHCKNFIRRYGNIVSINEDLTIETMFDVPAQFEFRNTSIALSEAIKKAPIAEVFFETFNELNSLPYESCSKTNKVFQLGVDSNVKRYTKEEAEKYGVGVVKPNEIRTFDHIYLSLDEQYVDKSGSSVESIIAGYRDAKNVFQRAMETISMDTLILVKDLINQGSLLDGQTHLYKIEQIIPLKREYDELHASKRDTWCWDKSFRLPFAKFRNELIGVLCSELSEGEELNKACQSWNKRVDPANYMKAIAPITSKQIEEAKKFVEENGYSASFNRRFATIDDIKVSEILHANVGDGRIKPASIFDGVKSTSTRHKRNEFEGVEEVQIEKFMKDILPGCTSIEAFLTNSHEGHMVSLTTAAEDSKPIFKWANNYSWTFAGNLAGKSQIKEVVKGRGGNVEGVLRFSMIWNESGKDRSDLDAWCKQSDGIKIGFNTEYRKDRGGRPTTSGGILDLDNTDPGTLLGVENIYFSSLNKMKDGQYVFWVNQYSARNSQGFKAEIEFNKETYYYEYNSSLHHNADILIATVTLKDGNFSITHHLPEAQAASKEIYGLETNKFHKVNLVCLSPNHWGENNVGNKHYFFMLDGCKSPVSIRSFHNENLLPELAQHRKVLEVLGTTNMIEPTDKQLSGLGFNATVRDELILSLKGSHKRVIKINF